MSRKRFFPKVWSFARSIAGGGGGDTDFGVNGILADQVRESTGGVGVLIDTLTKIQDATINWAGAGINSGDAKIVIKDNKAFGLKILDDNGKVHLYFRTDNGTEKNEFQVPLSIDWNNAGFRLDVGGIRSVNQTPSTAIDGTQENPTAFDNGFQFGAGGYLNKVGTYVFFETAIVHTVQAGGGFKCGVTLGGSSFMAAGGADIVPTANDRTIISGWFVTNVAGSSGKFVGAARVTHGVADGGAVAQTRLLTTGTGATMVTGGTYDLTTALTLAAFIDRQAGSADTNSSFSPYMIVGIIPSPV